MARGSRSEAGQARAQTGGVVSGRRAGQDWRLLGDLQVRAGAVRRAPGFRPRVLCPEHHSLTRVVQVPALGCGGAACPFVPRGGRAGRGGLSSPRAPSIRSVARPPVVDGGPSGGRRFWQLLSIPSPICI